MAPVRPPALWRGEAHLAELGGDEALDVDEPTEAELRSARAADRFFADGGCDDG